MIKSIFGHGDHLMFIPLRIIILMVLNKRFWYSVKPIRLFLFCVQSHIYIEATEHIIESLELKPIEYDNVLNFALWKKNYYSNSYNLRCVLYVVIKQRIPKLQDNEHYTFWDCYQRFSFEFEKGK